MILGIRFCIELLRYARLEKTLSSGVDDSSLLLRVAARSIGAFLTKLLINLNFDSYESQTLSIISDSSS